MPIPKVYSAGGERTLANYDYTDLAEGTGVVQFYGVDMATSSGTTYRLTTETIFSRNKDTEGDIPDGTTKVFDQDFDLTPFNMPKVVRGTAIVNIPIAVYVNSTNGAYPYCIITIQKVSNGVETNISSAIQSDGGSGVWDTLTSGNTTGKIFCMPIPLTQTIFKKGGILRVNVQIWAQKNGGAPRFLFGHDPQNRTYGVNSGDTSSVFSIYIPFRIDL